MDKKALLELTTDIVICSRLGNEMGKEELLEELQSVFQKLLEPCRIRGRGRGGSLRGVKAGRSGE